MRITKFFHYTYIHIYVCVYPLNMYIYMIYIHGTFILTFKKTCNDIINIKLVVTHVGIKGDYSLLCSLRVCSG